MKGEIQAAINSALVIGVALLLLVAPLLRRLRGAVSQREDGDGGL